MIRNENLKLTALGQEGRGSSMPCVQMKIFENGLGPLLQANLFDYHF